MILSTTYEQKAEQTQCHIMTMRFHEPRPFFELSIFKKLDSLLDDPRYESFIKINKEPSKKFRSVKDYIFCSYFPKFKTACLKYYKGEGHKLKDLLTVGDINYMDEIMCNSIKAIVGEVTS